MIRYARLAVGLGLFFYLCAASARAQPADKPPPDVRDAKYGPHERNVLDVWKPKSSEPTPLVVFIHGGGFRAGGKENLSPDLLQRCLKAGISVAAINYRLSQQTPFPAPFLDSARAIQFLRLKAAQWNLDPKRVAATGGSAGAGMSLWIGFHDDLADPQSTDPVAKQSTRLTCIAVQGAQTTYDPRAIKKLIGGRAHEHPALPLLYGLRPDEIDSPRAHKMYEEASPINYLTADDPPVFLFYNEPKGPLPENAKPGQGIHHPKFGDLLKEKMDALKIECVVRHGDDYNGKGNVQAELHREMVEFFGHHFARKTDPGAGTQPRPAVRSRPLGRPGEVVTPPARGGRPAENLKVGDLAPDFTLPDLAGKEQVSLASFKGKMPVVLVFGSYT